MLLACKGTSRSTFLSWSTTKFHTTSQSLSTQRGCLSIGRGVQEACILELPTRQLQMIKVVLAQTRLSVLPLLMAPRSELFDATLIGRFVQNGFPARAADELLK